MELEADETGEYESEIERGGEVALEQAWIQKVIHPAFNVRAGMIIVPVGLTNSHHLPNEFFTGYRQEGENTIFPCTWHEVGLELWGEFGRGGTVLLSGKTSAGTMTAIHGTLIRDQE